MRLGLLLILLSMPLIELALLIKVGQWIGFWPTMGIVVGTAIGGGLMLHQQGFAAFNRMADAMRQGKPPIEAAVDGAFIILAGLLMITPGLITDTFGMLLLVPPLRRRFAGWLLRRMGTYVEVRMGRTGDGEPARGPRNSDGSDGGVIIEGDFKRVDDPREGNDRRPPRRS